VQRARDQLLAGAGLAGDQHAGLDRVDLGDQLEHLLHRAALAEQLGEPDPAGELVAQREVVLDQRALLQGAADHRVDLVDLERLGQVVVRALLHRGDRGVGGRERGDQDDLGSIGDGAPAATPRAGSSRLDRAGAGPSTPPGILRSLTTMSIGSARSRSSASLPLCATATS
jgi:hypothetical protein